MFTFKRSALTWNDVRVGIFIVVGLAIIVTGIFFLEPGARLGKRFKVRSLYASVGGLTEGAPVMMSGVQVGTVTGIRVIRDPASVPSNERPLRELKRLKRQMDQINSTPAAGRRAYNKIRSKYIEVQEELKRVSVLMDVSSSEKDLVGASSTALIKNRGLVGEKYIDISTSGPESARLTPVADDTGVSAVEIPGEEPFDISTVLQNASSAAGSLNDLMSEVDTDITQGKGTLGKLIKDPSVHDNLKLTLQETARATRYTGNLMQSVNQGKGTIGKLFTNPELFNSTNDMFKSINSGQGTVGKLIHDPAAYNEMNATMSNMHSMLAGINQGRGTFGKLVVDPALYRNANLLMQSAGSIAASADRGKGTFGKLATDDALYANTNKAMSQMAELTGKMNKGQGTIGLLLQNRKIYDNLSAFSDEMVKFIKEFRANPKKYLTLQLNVIKFF